MKFNNWAHGGFRAGKRGVNVRVERIIKEMTPFLQASGSDVLPATC